MSMFLKIAASLTILSALTACTVIPPQVAYTGPSVGIVTVGPAPYYRGPGPYYAPLPPRGYGYRYGYGHRHW
jgi:hypothetical protein